MFAITLEEIEAAYAETGLKPIAGEWGDAKTCACPMSVVAIKRCGIEAFHSAIHQSEETAEWLAELLGIDSEVVIAFTTAYDGGPPMVAYTPEELEAYDVGRQARYRFPGVLTAPTEG